MDNKSAKLITFKQLYYIRGLVLSRDCNDRFFDYWTTDEEQSKLSRICNEAWSETRREILRSDATWAIQKLLEKPRRSCPRGKSGRKRDYFDSIDIDEYPEWGFEDCW